MGVGGLPGVLKQVAGLGLSVCHRSILLVGRASSRQLNAYVSSNARNEIVATDFVRHRSGQCRILPTSHVRHRGDEPRGDALDRVRRPTRRRPFAQVRGFAQSANDGDRQVCGRR
jgi:hypothetical protein